MEMMLALAIAMVVMLALYLTLNAQITHSNAGRDVVAEGALARNILAAIAKDINSQLAAADPRSLPDYSVVTGENPGTEIATIGANLGVSGDATSLVLSGLRVQKPRPVAPNATDMNVDAGTDLRRIAYWIVMNGNKSLGLARHETRQATASEIDLALTELPDQEKYVIAKEVKTIQFEYHGGNNAGDWQQFWNGAEPILIEEGTTLGPPAAIKITLTLKQTLAPGATDDDDTGPSYVHIVALPTGNNYPLPKK